MKKCKFALRQSHITGVPPQHLLKQNQELVLSDCNVSAKSLFLKRRVTRGFPICDGVQKPFNWEEEVQLRENNRMHRTIQDQSKGYKGGFKQGDCVRIQDTQAKGKMWRYLGYIKDQTAGKGSYNITLDSGDEIHYHNHCTRLEPIAKLMTRTQKNV